MEEAAKQRIKSTAGHLKWMPRRFAPHRILLIEMINPNPSPTWRIAFGLSWIGPSIIIGLEKSQSYQRFAGRQQEVLSIDLTDSKILPCGGSLSFPPIET